MSRPKRLLSLDGGGIRGVIAAEVLGKIEQILRDHNPRWKCLADYFDFFGGTSTGSILAAGLAKGMKARELLKFYVERGPRVFKQGFFSKIPIVGRLGTKYVAKPLEQELQKVFVDSTSQPLRLGSSELKALLMIVAKNATTGETWFFVNSEKNKFSDTSARQYLWQLIRASSAAPTYFPPITLQVGNKQHEFIDGGMSSYNNPSFQLFLEATVPEYGIGWEAGEQNLLLISVGTGFRDITIPFGKAKRYKALSWAPYAIDTFMDAANLQQNILMHLISRKQSSKGIDASSIPMTTPFRSLVTYHRYTISMTKERFDKLGLGHIDIEKIESLDCVDQIPALQLIGQKIAEEQVQKEDFEGFLEDDVCRPGDTNIVS